MKVFAGFLAATLVLTAIGGICLAVWRIEGSLAGVHDQTATLQFARAQESLDAAERYVGYTTWVPRLGNDFRDQIRIRQAVLQYWQGNYDALVAQGSTRDEAGEAPAVDLQLVVANAAYRDGQAHATNRAETLRALDEAVAVYATVLRNASWRRDAAFNYEYAARLRDEITKGRRPASPQAPETDLGLQGQPTSSGNQKFEIYIPLDSGDSRPAGGDAGKTPPGTRKG
jgi:hypothetical protein